MRYQGFSVRYFYTEIIQVTKLMQDGGPTGGGPLQPISALGRRAFLADPQMDDGRPMRARERIGCTASSRCGMVAE